jgi:ADP-dependent NAD(P)H-hydrate dehydratase / NAD(P)H-hydrate epimerase
MRDVYGRSTVPLLTAAESAEADRLAREEHGVPERVLMESAGRAAALVLQRLYPAGMVAGVAGSGNNGGDLLVMLRVLQSWGREVVLIRAAEHGPASELAHGDAVPEPPDEESAIRLLSGAAVLVDGILGTGAAGPPRGAAPQWIRRLNAAGPPVVALDLPSGVDATTGAVPAEAVRADVTVSFGWPKLGLLLHPARQQCGRLLAVEIGFPTNVAGSRTRLVTSGLIRAALVPRRPDAHKGSVGRLLVLAGSTGMAGAAVIAVEAALRGGAGLVRVASSAENRTILQATVPEATFLDSADLQGADLEAMHAVVAGPGLGTGAAARAALNRALELTGDVPVLLDADGLNLLAADAGALEAIAGGRPVVITPHARELSRLTGQSLEDILADPPGAARAAAARYSTHVLLKGQPSLIAAPGGELLVASAGSSDLATAGMGDQLAGTIGAFLAGGHPVAEAAALGLHLSGRAADLCALGRSLTPRDVSAMLAAALADPGPHESELLLPFISFDQPPRW